WNTGASTASVSVSPTLNTVYSITVSSTSQCTVSQNLNMAVLPLPQFQLTSSLPEVCAGSIVSLDVNGSDISNVVWSSGANTTSTTVTPTIQSVYSVTVTNSFSCSSTQTLAIYVKPLPVVLLISSSSPICT